jgi:hypothetical protein
MQGYYVQEPDVVLADDPNEAQQPVRINQT